jgi:hypothetical protein
MYTQCKLEKKISSTSRLTETAWIPSNFAKIGRNIEIKVGEKWDSGWVVIERYASANSAAMDTSRAAWKCFETVLTR